MAVNDGGGVKAMDVDEAEKGSIQSVANDKKNQLPWVEKYRPNK